MSIYLCVPECCKCHTCSRQQEVTSQHRKLQTEHSMDTYVRQSQVLNCRKLSSLEIENHKESSFENKYLNTAALTKKMVLLLFCNFKMRAQANLMLKKIFSFPNILTSYWPGTNEEAFICLLEHKCIPVHRKRELLIVFETIQVVSLNACKWHS